MGLGSEPGLHGPTRLSIGLGWAKWLGDQLLVRKDVGIPGVKDTTEVHTNALLWVKLQGIILIEYLACPQIHLDCVAWSVWDTTSQNLDFRYSKLVIPTHWRDYVENPCHMEGPAQIPQLVTRCRFQFFSRWNWQEELSAKVKNFFFSLFYKIHF